MQSRQEQVTVGRQATLPSTNVNLSRSLPLAKDVSHRETPPRRQHGNGRPLFQHVGSSIGQSPGQQSLERLFGAGRRRLRPIKAISSGSVRIHALTSERDAVPISIWTASTFTVKYSLER
jgi:hypothetical protein